MNAPAFKRLTVTEFLAWAEAQPKHRHELFRGEVVAMAPERARHVGAKQQIFLALHGAIRRSGLACRAFIDGLTVVIDDETSYIPDVLVNCGAAIAPDSMVAPNPVVVVEVLSPSTGDIDKTIKLADYFRVPGLVHYVVVDSDRRCVLHYRRQPGGDVAVNILTDGDLVFDPLGISIPVESCFD